MLGRLDSIPGEPSLSDQFPLEASDSEARIPRGQDASGKSKMTSHRMVKFIIGLHQFGSDSSHTESSLLHFYWQGKNAVS